MNQQNLTGLITLLATLGAACFGKYGLTSDNLTLLLTAIVGVVGAILTHHQADQAKQLAVAQGTPVVVPTSATVIVPQVPVVK